MASSTSKGNIVNTPAININFAKEDLNPFRQNQTIVNSTNSVSDKIYDHLKNSDSLQRFMKSSLENSVNAPVASSIKPNQKVWNNPPLLRLLRKYAIRDGTSTGSANNIPAKNAKQILATNDSFSPFGLQINAYAMSTGNTVNMEKHAIEKQV